MKKERVNRVTGSRRTFLKGAGIAGVGLATGAVVSGRLFSREQSVHAAAYSDAEILNFALNLEYLEAEFYAMSTYGATLVRLGVIKEEDESGPTTGGQRVPGFAASPAADMATALRTDEIDHVLYLRAALGSNAVKKPAIDLNALGYGFASTHSWMELARQFEDVGVSAYLGAAPLISSSTYLAAAAAILATEAQHSGSVRFACIMNGVTSPAVDSIDIPPTSKNFYDVNSHALSIPRTPSQVLNIVYHGGKCSGGFFPDGMNGSIVCQS
ncbi:ferritin-like domain-containing protein [Alloacidobacterium dinghuense]|uniref:Ferritin-like domain-containing protein n=1 Tax=Alloacidobacterium dinghuense TaxID=2763107 RepID=A0A7G8BCJ6_9BACT|nr:ferritin-like domain-containing protein [Alloacidobacterium dinghuense]QNI30266.1 ferritin-like domain-containing protein [Alloacidobacterium dinghuense]